jgi:hypothetical protein
MSRILYRKRMRKIALETEILKYSPSKSKDVMLMGVCGEQCLNTSLAW